MSGKSERSREIVEVARRFIEANGVDSFSMRVVGDELGIDPSAVYRHFPNRDALLREVSTTLLDEVDISTAANGRHPRERLQIAMRAVRHTMLASPIIAILLTTSGNNPSSTDVAIVGWAVDQLKELGLQHSDIAVAYQLLEAFVYGITTYDISSQPDPLEVRRQWYRSTEIPEFDVAIRNTSDVEKLNNEVFETGLDAILDAIESMASK